MSCDAHAVIGGFGWGPRSAEIADGWRGFLHHLSDFAPLDPLVLFLRRLSTGGVDFVRLKARVFVVLYDVYCKIVDLEGKYTQTRQEGFLPHPVGVINT